MHPHWNRAIFIWLLLRVIFVQFQTKDITLSWLTEMWQLGGRQPVAIPRTSGGVSATYFSFVVGKQGVDSNNNEMCSWFEYLFNFYWFIFYLWHFFSSCGDGVVVIICCWYFTKEKERWSLGFFYFFCKLSIPLYTRGQTGSRQLIKALQPNGTGLDISVGHESPAVGFFYSNFRHSFRKGRRKWKKKTLVSINFFSLIRK